MTYQKVIVVGNLGRDPELRYMPNGNGVCNFSLATNRSYTKDGNKVNEVTWFRITAWGSLAETVNQYLKKGSKVLVEGRLSPSENGGPRVYEIGGEWRASYEVTADKVVFLDSKSDRTAGYAMRDESFGDGTPVPVGGEDDDLPF